ncbi:hypothetical protein ACFQXB_06420 [Plastorhodobacter daqingensis]|uniref:Excalibur calcium-binding domain-containing protein n=1 Tax=Plastorhodobacter daqingensis TaxID=1387281 RepID=A0ABW2UGM3_9RHOB
MRYFLATACFLALAACQPSGQASGGYNDFLRDREVRGAGGNFSPITGAPVTSAPLGSSPQGATAPGAIAASGGPRISDEQDFEAVAARESIESDRERLERQRAQYVFIEPTSVPERTGNEGPNIISYALNTRNNPGDQVYRRMNPLRFSQWERNCSRFATQDQAQLEFLRRGGPDRDPGNLDPDGDGFACWWDPRPFRAAVR